MLFSSQPGRWHVDKESGYLYTVVKSITRRGIVMNQIKIGNRVVVIAGTATANEKSSHQGIPNQRPTARRIVVIKNSELVGSRPGR